MKQVGDFILVMLCAAAFLLAGYAAAIGYSDHEKLKSLKKAVEQKELVYSSDEFFTVSDVLVQRQILKEDKEVERIFLEMPEETLKDVAKVVLGKSSMQSCNPYTIVEEYKLNYDNVYKHLEKEDPPREQVPDTITLKKETPDTILSIKNTHLTVE
jgi:hypothetical protein